VFNPENLNLFDCVVDPPNNYELSDDRSLDLPSDVIPLFELALLKWIVSKAIDELEDGDARP
jgi:hypothetical protein